MLDLVLIGGALLASLAGLVALWDGWKRGADMRVRGAIALSLWIASTAIWIARFGAEIGIPLALETAAIVAFAFILSRMERRSARAPRARTVAAPPRPRWRILIGSLRALVAGPLGLIAALGIAVVVATQAPMAEQTRLILAGLIVPTLWAIGIGWVVCQRRLAAQAAAFAIISLAGFGLTYFAEHRPMRLPRISPEFTRSMLDGHGLIGVIFGAVIYMLCLSGSLIVLVDQLTIWEQPQAPVVRQVTPDLLQRVSEEAYTRAKATGAAHDMFINAPTPELPQLTVMAFGERGEAGPHHEWSVDANGGFAPEVKTPWVLFVQQLHFNLTLPGALGRYIVGILGTILLASLITGILAHRRILKDAFRLRWGGGKRLTNADLHNRIGVWALPFHLIVSLTGSLLGMSGLIILILALVAYKGDQAKAIASLLGPQPSEDSRAAPVPDLHPMLAAIEAETPGARVSQVRLDHVGTAGQLVTISIAAPGHLTRAESYVFSPDGTLKQKAGFTDGNIGMRIFGMITPLHYGTYGGVPLKIIYALLGMGLTMIVATGGNIWLSRRRDQGRTAPKLERLWAGLLWGQPLALVLAGLLEIAAGIPSLPVYWGVTLFGLAMALGIRDVAAASKALRLGTGVALLLLAVVHVARNGVANPTALCIDLLWVVAGFAVIVWGANYLPQRTRDADGNLAAAE